MISFNKNVKIELELDNHDESSIQSSLFNLTQAASIATETENGVFDFSALNSAIETAGTLFQDSNDESILVVMSDFFSTDFDYPDSAVIGLSAEGIRTIALGISDTVIHSHWLVTGLTNEMEIWKN